MDVNRTPEILQEKAKTLWKFLKHKTLVNEKKYKTYKNLLGKVKKKKIIKKNYYIVLYTIQI